MESLLLGVSARRRRAARARELQGKTYARAYSAGIGVQVFWGGSFEQTVIIPCASTWATVYVSAHTAGGTEDLKDTAGSEISALLHSYESYGGVIKKGWSKPVACNHCYLVSRHVDAR
jgi:hypothetical protein